MRLQKKSYSRLSLGDLLRRRRSNLKKFLTESGIVTYELLTSRCDSMGVVPPSEQEFNDAKGNPVMHNVSSPTEGVVVLEPPRMLVPPEDAEEYSKESSQEQIQDNYTNTRHSKKKSKGKKPDDSSE